MVGVVGSNGVMEHMAVATLEPMEAMAWCAMGSASGSEASGNGVAAGASSAELPKRSSAGKRVLGSALGTDLGSAAVAAAKSVVYGAVKSAATAAVKSAAMSGVSSVVKLAVKSAVKRSPFGAATVDAAPKKSDELVGKRAAAFWEVVWE